MAVQESAPGKPAVRHWPAKAAAATTGGAAAAFAIWFRHDTQVPAAIGGTCTGPRAAVTQVGVGLLQPVLPATAVHAWHTLVARLQVGVAPPHPVPPTTPHLHWPSIHCPLAPHGGLFPHLHLLIPAPPPLISHLSPTAQAAVNGLFKLQTHLAITAPAAVTVSHTGPLENDAHDVEAPHLHVR